MKRRWVCFHAAIVLAIFGLIMQAAHIGSINLWITVSGLVFAEEIIVLVTLNAARRRFMPLAELPTSEGRMEVLS